MDSFRRWQGMRITGLRSGGCSARREWAIESGCRMSAGREVFTPSAAEELDRVIHEPARLRIMTVLSGVADADFNFLLSALGLTKGNLSTHAERLERVGYVE